MGLRNESNSPSGKFWSRNNKGGYETYNIAHGTQYSKPPLRKTERSSAQWWGGKAEFHEGTELEAAS